MDKPGRPRRDRHKADPISLRIPGGDLAWLRQHAEETGQPVRRILLKAIVAYREQVTTE